MATTNHTPHYNLPQWATGDKVGILANLNPAFDTIDTNLFEAVTDSEAAVNTANNASQLATSASQAINELQPDVLKNGADILTLQNLVNSLQTSLNNSKIWDTLTVKINSSIADADSSLGPYCKLRRDKEFMSLYGTLVLKKPNLRSGDILFTIQGLNPSSSRGVYCLLWIPRTLSDGTSRTVFINGTIDVNGNVKSSSNLDMSTDKTNAGCGIQLFLCTADWFN